MTDTLSKPNEALSREQIDELIEEIPSIRDYYRGSSLRTIEQDINRLCDAVMALRSLDAEAVKEACARVCLSHAEEYGAIPTEYVTSESRYKDYAAERALLAAAKAIRALDVSKINAATQGDTEASVARPKGNTSNPAVAAPVQQPQDGVAVPQWKSHSEPFVPPAIWCGHDPAMSTEEFTAAIAQCCESFGTTSETAHMVAAVFAQARDSMLAARPKE